MVITTGITAHIAHVVLFHYGCGDVNARIGYLPSGFITHLLRAITIADPDNRNELAKGFPGWVRACNLLEAGHAEVLREIATSAREAEETAATS